FVGDVPSRLYSYSQIAVSPLPCSYIAGVFVRQGDLHKLARQIGGVSFGGGFIEVPSRSRLRGAFGLLSDNGQSATQPSNNPPCFRYSMKNGSWPKGVPGPVAPHSTS